MRNGRSVIRRDPPAENFSAGGSGDFADGRRSDGRDIGDLRRGDSSFRPLPVGLRIYADTLSFLRLPFFEAKALSISISKSDNTFM